MANLNKVMLMGNLTRDPELKSTAGGQSLCRFSLAVNRKWKAGDGTAKEEVTFIDCEAWGKTGETIAKYMAKGRALFVEGRLKLDQWEKDGEKRSKMGVVVEGFQFIDANRSVESKPTGGSPVAPVDNGDEGASIPF